MKRTTNPKAAEAEIGHNSGETETGTEADTVVVAGHQLRSFIERIERLMEDRQDVNQDISDIYAEMRGSGWDTKAVRQLVRLRKMDQAERQEREAIVNLYKAALGME